MRSDLKVRPQIDVYHVAKLRGHQSLSSVWSLVPVKLEKKMTSDISNTEPKRLNELLIIALCTIRTAEKLQCEQSQQ